MEPAGNLKYPSRPVHLPTITYSDVAFFKDSVEGKYKLVLPNHGITVPMDSNTSIAMSLPHKGVNKIIALEVNALAPCEDCDYEYGFQVRLGRKQPGVDNDEFHGKFYHFYSKLEKFTVSDGLIDDAYQTMMINDLHTQMVADTDLMTYCKVAKIYEVSFVTATDATVVITINNSAGTETTQTWTGATSNPAALKKDMLDDLVVSDVVATAWTDGTSVTLKYIIDSTEELVSIEGAATSFTVRPIGIALSTKTFDFEPEILFEDAQFIRDFFSYAWIPTIAATFNHRFVTSDDSYNATVTADDTCAELAVAVNAGITTTGFKAYGVDGDGVLIYVPNSKLDIIPLASAAAVTPVVFSQSFQWPQLTSDEVFKVFAHSQHLGELSVLQRTSKPADVPYVKITINYNGHNQASFHGASQTANASQRVYIYLPKTVLETNIFIGGETSIAAAITAGTGNRLLTGEINSLASLLEDCIADTTNIGCKEGGSFTDFVPAWSNS